MIKTIKILFAILLFYSCSSSRKIKETTEISYISTIGIVENCSTQEIIKEITLTTNSIIPIQVYDINGAFTIICNDKELTNKDTLLLSKKQVIKLNVKLNIDSLSERKSRILYFSTNHPKYKRKIIEFIPKTLILTSKDIQSGQDIIIDKTSNCIDSLSIIFPYGGTISTVNLYKEPQNEPFKSISYMMFDNNKIDLNNIEIGNYHLNFSSCHWGNNLRVIIK